MSRAWCGCVPLLPAEMGFKRHPFYEHKIAA